MNSAGFQLCYGCWSLIWYTAIIKNVINSWSCTDVISHRAHNDPRCSYTKAFWQIRWLPGKGCFYLSFKYIKRFLMGSWPIGWFHVKIQEKETSGFHGVYFPGAWRTGSLGTGSLESNKTEEETTKSVPWLCPQTLVSFRIFFKYLPLTPL